MSCHRQRRHKNYATSAARRSIRPSTSSSATAKRGTTAAWLALLGAAGVTCVAVRCSAWLGDGSFNFRLTVLLLQEAVCLVGIVVALDALRIVRDSEKYLKRRKEEDRDGQNQNTIL